MWQYIFKNLNGFHSTSTVRSKEESESDSEGVDAYFRIVCICVFGGATVENERVRVQFCFVVRWVCSQKVQKFVEEARFGRKLEFFSSFYRSTFVCVHSVSAQA